MMTEIPTAWTSTEADARHLEALRKALAGSPDGLSDASIISYALRTAAESLGVLEAPESPLGALAGPIEADPGQPVTVHTDGACSSNPGPGGWGVVLTQGGTVLGKFSGQAPSTTNNRMELTAVREALKCAPEGVPLEIITDSKNVIGWLSGGWKRNAPAISALCREIDPLLVGRKVTWTWVKGHAGDVLNDRVDRLAVAAIERQHCG